MIFEYKNIDPYKKHIGYPNKYNYDFYIKQIITVTINGLSWNKLSLIINIDTDLIRKKYNKWVKLDLFTKVNNIILKQYNKKHKYKTLFIDSTNIINISGCFNFGYNIKNKKSIKISVLVDHNKIPHITDISKGSIHDAKIMETVINNKLNNNKHNFNLVGDKGYIKNKDYVNTLKDTNIITLITPTRINSKQNNIISDNNKILLKERYKVENFFSLLKRGYKRIIIINDKTLSNYYGFLNIAITLITLKIIINL